MTRSREEPEVKVCYVKSDPAYDLGVVVIKSGDEMRGKVAMSSGDAIISDQKQVKESGYEIAYYYQKMNGDMVVTSGCGDAASGAVDSETIAKAQLREHYASELQQERLAEAKAKETVDAKASDKLGLPPDIFVCYMLKENTKEGFTKSDIGKVAAGASVNVVGFKHELPGVGGLVGDNGRFVIHTLEDKKPDGIDARYEAVYFLSNRSLEELQRKGTHFGLGGPGGETRKELNPHGHVIAVVGGAEASDAKELLDKYLTKHADCYHPKAGGRMNNPWTGVELSRVKIQPFSYELKIIENCLKESKPGFFSGSSDQNKMKFDFLTKKMKEFNEGHLLSNPNERKDFGASLEAYLKRNCKNDALREAAVTVWYKIDSQVNEQLQQRVLDALQQRPK